jgi:hypothetical protein
MKPVDKDAFRLPRLPQDILETVRKRSKKRILRCVVMEIAILLFLMTLGERIFSAMGGVLQYTVYAFLLVLPCLLTGLPKALTDRDWSGTVTRVRVKTKTTYTTDAQILQNIVILTLVDPKGKPFRKTVAAHNVQASKGGIHLGTSNTKVEHYINDYQVGDRVYHFRGLPYPLVVGPNYKDRITCVICGHETQSDRNRCWNCDHSLLKLK